jgi:hypothetical protein
MNEYFDNEFDGIYNLRDERKVVACSKVVCLDLELLK